MKGPVHPAKLKSSNSGQSIQVPESGPDSGNFCKLTVARRALSLAAVLFALPLTTLVLPVRAADELRPPIDDSANKTDDFDQIEEKETILIDPEKMIVKPPALKALITLEQPLDPLHIDADGKREIDLGDVLKEALGNNLAIKISRADEKAGEWNYYGSMGRFLPDLMNSVSYQGLKGAFASPAGAAIRINSPYLNTVSSFNLYLYRGGGIVHGALLARHQLKATRQGLSGTINDVLLEATKLYYDLVLQDALLQIRVKAVEESKSILKLNEDLYEEGAATRLEVMQARSQLSRDRQALISQQVKRRQAAIDLATALYLNPERDLTVNDRVLAKTRLVDSRLPIGSLVNAAVKSRPELARYEQLRLAAREQVKVAKAPLLPTVSFGGAVAGTGASVARNTNQQQVPLASGTSGDTSVTPVVSGGGSLPLVQGTGSSTEFDMRALFLIGVDVQWKLGAMGVPDLANIQKSRWLARRAQLECNSELYKVYQQVRNAFTSSIDAESLVKETTAEVDSSEEALRIAVLRLKEGLGTQTDVVVAQRDYTQALINKASSLIQYNTAQATLLHRLGLISFNTLTRGLKTLPQ